MKSKFVHLPHWAQSRPSRPQVSLPGNAKVASLFSASLMSYPLSTSILSLGTSTRSSQGHTTETRGWALVTSLHNKGETDSLASKIGRGGEKNAPASGGCPAPGTERRTRTLTRSTRHLPLPDSSRVSPPQTARPSIEGQTDTASASPHSRACRRGLGLGIRGG